MAIMSISLPDSMMDFVVSQAAREGFPSVSEYLLSVLRAQQKKRAKQELEAKLLEGLEGPAVEMTREDWDSIRREAIEGLSGETIRP